MFFVWHLQCDSWSYNSIIFLFKSFCPLIFTEFIYICKANEDKGQDLSHTCRKLNDIIKYNCTCFVDYTPDVHYLDCYDALIKGQNESGIYSLKPDNMSPFKVQHCL